MMVRFLNNLSGTMGILEYLTSYLAKIARTKSERMNIIARNDLVSTHVSKSECETHFYIGNRTLSDLAPNHTQGNQNPRASHTKEQ
jgi:hypothetical protein